MDARIKSGHDDGACGGRVIGRLNQDAHDVGLLHDQEFLAVELDLGARPFAEQHAVADLEVDRDQLAGLVAAAGADCRDLTLRGLFLGRVGDDDAALGLLFGVDTLDHDTVMQRTEFGFSHDVSLDTARFTDLVGSRTPIAMRPYSTPGWRQLDPHYWQSSPWSANRGPEIWPGEVPVKQR